jgi:hypothetical protein
VEVRIDRTTIAQTVVDADEAVGCWERILIIAALACARRTERARPDGIALSVLCAASLSRIDLYHRVVMYK